MRVVPVGPRLATVLEMIRVDPDGEDLPPDAFVLGDEIGQRIASVKTAWRGSCTLSLLSSSIRTSPLPYDGEYRRQGSEDTRFVDYFGTTQSIVTSIGSNDDGVFETSLRDERFLPFEGASA